MSPNMSSQLITKKHYMVSPMHSSLHKSFCFHFISYSKVLKLQKWWSWWWRWWLGNNVITAESLSYRITLYLTDRHMPVTLATSIYILVWCIGMGMVYIYWYVQPYYHHPFRGGFWILCFSSVEPSKPHQKRHTRKSKAKLICKNICDGYWTFVIWFCC